METKEIIEELRAVAMSSFFDRGPLAAVFREAADRLEDLVEEIRELNKELGTAFRTWGDHD